MWIQLWRAIKEWRSSERGVEEEDPGSKLEVTGEDRREEEAARGRDERARIGRTHLQELHEKPK